MKNKFDSDTEKEIILEYLAGKTAKQICQIYDCSDGTIYNVLKRNNVSRRAAKRIAPVFNHQYFDNIDTEDKAYFYGLLAADGSVCRKKRRGNLVFTLELQTRDIETIKNFCNAIEYPVSKIGTYKRADRKPTSKITIYNDYFCNRLESLGIVSGKAFSFQLPDLSPSLMRHFLRGFFDGDGHVTAQKLTLCAGNRYVLEEIKSFLDKELKLNPKASKIYETGKNARTLCFNRQLERIQVYLYLYSNCNNAMSRKAHYLNTLVVKFRELLGSPEEGNQQPSLGGNSLEGPTTRSNSLSETMKAHERGTHL